MSWTTPRTWVVGEIVTAAEMNTHVRDNFSWMYGESSRIVKTTAKAVSTASEADLLNGEFTLSANDLHSNRLMRLTAWGDCAFASGGAQAPPRFRFKMGSGPTTILDTNTAGTIGNSATRGSWRIVVELQALGATNAQWATLVGQLVQPANGGVGAGGGAAFATGSGVYVTNSAAGGNGFDVAMRGGAAATIDTTSNQAVILTVLTASGTSTDVTLKGAEQEILGGV